MKDKSNPLFLNAVSNVTVRTDLDARRKDESKPISVIVTYMQKRHYYRTGERVTNEEYASLLKAKITSNSEYAKRKAEIQKKHFRILDIVKSLIDDSTFSLIALDEAINGRYDSRDTTFYEYYVSVMDSKNCLKTREAYKRAIVSFLKSYGAKMQITHKDNGKQEKKQKLIIPDSALKLMPKDITATAISHWQKQLKDEGKSAATISIYSRSIKTALRAMQKDGLIKVVPDISVPQGTRRTENFFSVQQVLRLMEYQGKYDWARDFWMILYFCNGCNARDLVSMKWGEDYFQNKELSFVRSKTKEKSPSLVLIPIIEPLEKLLMRYATNPKRGASLFPVLLNGAKTEEELSKQADYLNSRIREGMEIVCAELDLPKASPAWARNSYITALTWHGISDAFIDNMTGHIGGNSVLRGYQGRISPAKRHKINSLLIVPPEE